MRLEHVNLTVADIERSADFYGRLLGIRERWRGTTTAGAPAVHVGNDDFYLALFEGEPRDVPVDYERVGFNHVGFVVDDIDAAREALASLGATIHHEADYEPGRRAYVFDPDGYEIELVAYS